MGRLVAPSADQAACFSRSPRTPLSKRAPPRTRGTGWAGDRTPSRLSGLDQLEHHRERGRRAARTPPDLGPELDRRGGRLDGVRTRYGFGRLGWTDRVGP